ncbi:MAG: hypothetical protein LBS83_02615 [Holosporales bacterium]|jgi:hypothetical protein|nr:hypothetical protein [Holosporales bacterium]
MVQIKQVVKLQAVLLFLGIQYNCFSALQPNEPNLGELVYKDVTSDGKQITFNKKPVRIAVYGKQGLSIVKKFSDKIKAACKASSSNFLHGFTEYVEQKSSNEFQQREVAIDQASDFSRHIAAILELFSAEITGILEKKIETLNTILPNFEDATIQLLDLPPNCPFWKILGEVRCNDRFVNNLNKFLNDCKLHRDNLSLEKFDNVIRLLRNAKDDFNKIWNKLNKKNFSGNLPNLIKYCTGLIKYNIDMTMQLATSIIVNGAITNVDNFIAGANIYGFGGILVNNGTSLHCQFVNFLRTQPPEILALFQLTESIDIMLEIMELKKVLKTVQQAHGECLAIVNQKPNADFLEKQIKPIIDEVVRRNNNVVNKTSSTVDLIVFDLQPGAKSECRLSHMFEKHVHDVATRLGHSTFKFPEKPDASEYGQMLTTMFLLMECWGKFRAIEGGSFKWQGRISKSYYVAQGGSIKKGKVEILKGGQSLHLSLLSWPRAFQFLSIKCIVFL